MLFLLSVCLSRFEMRRVGTADWKTLWSTQNSVFRELQPSSWPLVWFVFRRGLINHVSNEPELCIVWSHLKLITHHSICWSKGRAEEAAEKWIFQIAHTPRLPSERYLDWDVNERKKVVNRRRFRNYSTLSLFACPLNIILKEFQNPMESESSRQNVRVSFGLVFRRSPQIKNPNSSQRSLTVAVYLCNFHISELSYPCDFVTCVCVWLRCASLCTTLAACFHFWAWPDRQSK